MTNKKESITRLISSHSPEVINNRFLVQYSKMSNGVHKDSFMLVIVDMVDEGFSLKYFNTTDEVISVLKLLKAS